MCSKQRERAQWQYSKITQRPVSKHRVSQLNINIENDEKSVRQTLVERNLRLVVYIAKKFENTGVDLEDLISIGTIGLMKGVNTFKTDKNILILSKSAAAGLDLIKKIQDMVMSLEPHLRPGITKWNQSSIAFDNNSVISTEAFSPTAGLGKTINFLILDEFAWCPPNEV